jgi:hypothetical protein
MNEKHTCPLLSSDKRAMLEKILSQDTSWQRQDGTAYPMGNAALGAALEAGASWERREPARPAELAGDVAVPLAQAVITGVIGGLVGGLLSGWAPGLVAGSLTFGASWLILLVDHRRGLWLVERLIGADIDQDGSVGEPARFVRVEVSEKTKGGEKVKYSDIPASDKQLRELALALFVKRQPFSRKALAGKGKPFSDPQFRKLQKVMRDADLLWPAGEGHNAGFKLNSAGRQFLTQFLPKG